MGNLKIHIFGATKAMNNDDLAVRFGLGHTSLSVSYMSAITEFDCGWNKWRILRWTISFQLSRKQLCGLTKKKKSISRKSHQQQKGRSSKCTFNLMIVIKERKKRQLYSPFKIPNLCLISFWPADANSRLFQESVNRDRRAVKWTWLIVVLLITKSGKKQSWKMEKQSKLL